jgi:hypothetical protein
MREGGVIVLRPNPKKNKMYGTLHRNKKAFRYSRPQPGCHLPNSPWAGIMTSYVNYSCLFVSDILAGEGNIEKLFFRYMPKLTITSPNVHSRVDSNTFTMGNSMPESTLTLCQSRQYLPVRDFGFTIASEVWIFIRPCNLGGEGCGLCAEYAEVAVKGPCHRCTTQHFLGVFCK